MVKYDVKDPTQWGPIIDISDSSKPKDTLKPGDIIGLNTVSRDLRHFFVYRIVSNVGAECHMELRRTDENGSESWCDGHSWNFSDGGGFYCHYIGPGAVLKRQEPGGCICRRCNSKNEWAEPNQKDGGYICYECR